MSCIKDLDIEELYLEEIEDYKPLPIEEQEELIKRYQEQNDREAYLKLFHHSLRLSVYVAKMKVHKCKSMKLLDLIQENNLTLMQAIEEYDSSREASFSTYTIEMMINLMTNTIAEKDETIQKKYKRKTNYLKYIEFINMLKINYNRIPTDEEVKKELGISDKVLSTLKLVSAKNPVSLNIQIPQDDSKQPIELVDLIKDDNNQYSKVEHEYDELILLQSIKEYLTKQEYYIIYNRLIKSPAMSLEEVADEIGISRATVYRREKEILKKIRRVFKRIQSETLKKYTLEDLKQKSIRALTPIEISNMYFLKTNLSPLSYYIAYNMKINPSDNNLEFYLKKFPLYTKGEIEEEISSVEELLNKLSKNNKKQRSIYEYYRETKTILQIFELDITPEKQNTSIKKPYQKKVETIK